ncbi:MAG: OmpA family protein [Bacteroidales bacterium]|jgi:outer membrane protein OmpA-like peptidoglycan-associated protein
MRILITGCVAFVIWCFFSSWLYNDILLPVMRKPVPVVTAPENQSASADSLARLKASMPKELSIYFEFNGTKFKPDPQYDSDIAAFKAWLNKYPASMISVTGYTDLVGTEDFNNALGLKRAHVVGKYLEDNGITTDRIIAESRGKDTQARDYITCDGRAKSRRTEISIKMQ